MAATVHVLMRQYAWVLLMSKTKFAYLASGDLGQDPLMLKQSSVVYLWSVSIHSMNHFDMIQLILTQLWFMTMNMSCIIMEPVLMDECDYWAVLDWLEQLCIPLAFSVMKRVSEASLHPECDIHFETCIWLGEVPPLWHVEEVVLLALPESLARNLTISPQPWIFHSSILAEYGSGLCNDDSELPGRGWIIRLHTSRKALVTWSCLHAVEAWQLRHWTGL